MKSKRILSRILARELSKEELGLVGGGDTVVTTLDAFAAGGDESTDPRPPLSTLVATLPDYSEDQ